MWPGWCTRLDEEYKPSAMFHDETAHSDKDHADSRFEKNDVAIKRTMKTPSAFYCTIQSNYHFILNHFDTIIHM